MAISVDWILHENSQPGRLRAVFWVSIIDSLIIDHFKVDDVRKINDDNYVKFLSKIF